MELAITEPDAVAGYRLGVEIVVALKSIAPRAFRWREKPYEFVADRPAIDLLTGGDDFRRALEGGGDLDSWLESWTEDEREFREERAEILLYPEAKDRR